MNSPKLEANALSLVDPLPLVKHMGECASRICSDHTLGTRLRHEAISIFMPNRANTADILAMVCSKGRSLPAMMVLALIAAAINLWCLKLLRQIRSTDVNMQAAETFSFNDFISNGGVLIAGAMVLWTGASWPDLVAGTLIAGVATVGGVGILRSVWADKQERSHD